MRNWRARHRPCPGPHRSWPSWATLPVEGLATALACALASLLAACSDSAPAPLPTEVVIEAPAGWQDLPSTLHFSANAGVSNPGLQWQWQFGDGSTSTEANPSHHYAQAGRYEVSLVLSNAAGQSKTARAQVRVADLALTHESVCRPAGPALGWCWQAPLPQGNVLFDHLLAADRPLWAVGELGTLLRSDDGGSSWQAAAGIPRTDLLAVAAPTRDVAWVVGDHGLVLRTLDKGASWRSFSAGDDVVRPVTLQALDASTAWITAGDGVARLTTDGGQTWTRLAPPGAELGFSSVTLRDAQDAWALLRTGPQGPRLWRRVLPGGDWTELPLPRLAAGSGLQLAELQFDARGRALLVGDELRLDFSAPAARRAWWRDFAAGRWVPLALPAAVQSGPFTSLRLQRDGSLYAVQTGAGSRALRTTDDGVQWSEVAGPAVADAPLLELRPFGAERLSATDGRARLYASADGGASWRPLGASRAFGARLGSVWAFDRRHVLAAGDQGLLRTLDGGRSWQREPGGDGLGIVRLHFAADGRSGWAIVDGNRVVRSLDQGHSWSPSGSFDGGTPPALADLQFIDAQRGWALSFLGTAAGSLFYTTDGGQRWQAASGAAGVEGLAALRFGDADRGVAVGPAGTAFVSGDGGRSWTRRPTGIALPLNALAFSGERTVLAVGEAGVIVRSTDAGQNWQSVASPTTQALRAIRFVSPDLGYAVGGNGTVLHTRDGGRSWVAQDAATSVGLNALGFVDELTGWIVGDGGSILATATGGP